MTYKYHLADWEQLYLYSFINWNMALFRIFLLPPSLEILPTIPAWGLMLKCLDTGSHFHRGPRTGTTSCLICLHLDGLPGWTSLWVPAQPFFLPKCSESEPAALSCPLDLPPTLTPVVSLACCWSHPVPQFWVSVLPQAFYPALNLFLALAQQL